MANRYDKMEDYIESIFNVLFQKHADDQKSLKDDLM